MKLTLILLLLVCGVYSQACTLKSVENWNGTYIKTDSQGSQCGYAFRASSNNPARTLYSNSTNGTINYLFFDLVVSAVKLIYRASRQTNFVCPDLTNSVIRLIGSCSDDKIEVVDTDGYRLIGNKFGEEIVLVGKSTSFNLWKN